MSTSSMNPGDALCAGRYRIVRKLNSGKKAHAYLCVDEKLGDEVVCRVPLEGTSQIEEFKAQYRLLFRASICPGLARVRHYDEQDGVPIIVVEFVPGPTLEDWLKGKPSIGERLEKLGAVLDALETLHVVGIDHGDVHEGNIIVTEDRTVLIDPDGGAWGGSRDWFGGREGIGPEDHLLLGLLVEDLFTEKERSRFKPLMDIRSAMQKGKDLKEIRSRVDRLRISHEVLALGDVRTVAQSFGDDYEERTRQALHFQEMRYHAIQSLEDTFTTVFQAMNAGNAPLKGMARSYGEIKENCRQEKGAIESDDPHLRAYDLVAKSREGGKIEFYFDREGHFDKPWPRRYLNRRLLARGDLKITRFRQQVEQYELHIPIPQDPASPLMTYAFPELPSLAGGGPRIVKPKTEPIPVTADWIKDRFVAMLSR